MALNPSNRWCQDRDSAYHDVALNLNTAGARGRQYSGADASPICRSLSTDLPHLSNPATRLTSIARETLTVPHVGMPA